MFRHREFRSILRCVQRTLMWPNLAQANEKSSFRLPRADENSCYTDFRESLIVAIPEVCRGGDASQAGMGAKAEFSRLGLYQMRGGVQPFRAGVGPLFW